MKLAKIEEFVSWASREGEFTADIHTHVTRQRGQKHLNNKSRVDGSPCPYPSIIVRTIQAFRLGVPMKAGELSEDFRPDDTHPNYLVKDVRSGEQFLTCFPASLVRKLSYFTEDKRELDWETEVSQYWMARNPKKSPDSPIELRRSTIILTTLDKIDAGGEEWVIVP